MYDLVSEIANTCAARNEQTLIFTKNDEVSGKVSEAVGYEADIFSNDNLQSYYYFAEGKCKILITSEDLGIGINFPNIRNIIHFGMPLSKNEYVQEIGRAGRANERVTSYVLYLQNSPGNVPEGLLRRGLDINALSSKIGSLRNDYGYIYRKLTNNCPTTDALLKELIDMKDELWSRNRSTMLQTYADDEVKSAKEYLFMLYTCGFINDWYTYTYNVAEGTSIFISLINELDERLMKTRMQKKLRDYFAELGTDNRKAMVETSRAKTINEILKVYVDWYFEKYLYRHNEEFMDVYEFITESEHNTAESITDEIKNYYVLPFVEMKSEEAEYNDMDLRQISEKAVAGFSPATLANLERMNSNRYSYKLDYILFCGRLRNNGNLEHSRLNRLIDTVPSDKRQILDDVFRKLYPACEVKGRLEILKYLSVNGSKHNIILPVFIDTVYQTTPKDEIYYGMAARRLNTLFKKRKRY